MPQSLRTVAIHGVFATQHRQHLIEKGIRCRLHGIISGVISDLGGVLVAAGSVDDHIHLLILMPRDVSIAQLVQKIKISGSIFMKVECGMSNFSWQRGYAACSVSPSGIRAVKRYILNQEEHHKKSNPDKERHRPIVLSETSVFPSDTSSRVEP